MPRFVPSVVADAVQPIVRQQAANAPRMINFTGQPFQNMTLQALEQRQQDYAQQAAQPMPEIRHPLQGVAHLLDKFNAVSGERMAAEQEYADRSKVAELMTRLDPRTGEIHPNALSDIGAIDPELQQKIYFDLKAREAAAAKEGAAAGTWKPSDIGSLRDDYTKAATTYDSAAPAWEDMKRAAATALDPNNMNKGPATYALIVGYAKLLDPTSVVREGEVKAATDLGGMLDTINGWLEKAKTGGMEASVLTSIMQQADSRMRGYYDQVKEKRDWVAEIATRHGLDPRDVVAPLGTYAGWAVPEEPEEPDVDPDNPPPPDDVHVVSERTLPDGSIEYTMSDGSKVVRPAPKPPAAGQ